MKVKVTDPASKYLGQEFEGSCIYYDIYHTGSTPEKPAIDLFLIHTPDGDEQILSNKIDADHYWEQVRQEHIKKLGANIGDTVLIIEHNACSCNAKFEWDKPHKITSIDSSGHVRFDDNAACCFRPVVKVVQS